MLAEGSTAAADRARRYERRPRTVDARRGLGRLPRGRACDYRRLRVAGRRRPTAPRCARGTVLLSYAELAARAYRIAHAILAQRGGREEPVALLLEQGPDLIAAILGALAAGKAYLPLDPAHPPERSQRALADCGPPLLLASSAQAATRPGLDGPGRPGPGPGRPRPRSALHRPEAPARARPPRLHLLHLGLDRPTQGRRGLPPQRAAQRDALHRQPRIGCRDRLTLLQSCAYSGSVSSLFAALLNGASSHPVDLRREGIQGLARRVEAERITMFHGVPAIFRELAATTADLTSLRVIRLEGDLAGPPDALLFRRRFRAGCTLVNGLGATETGLSCQYFLAPDSPCAARRCRSATRPRASRSTWSTMPARRQRSAKLGNRRPQPLSRPGLLAQPRAHRGQVPPRPGRRAALPQRRPRPRRTDGAIELLGRKDLQVRLRGEWVDTSAIEAALLELGPVREAAVVPRELRPGRPELVAYILPAAGLPPSSDALRGALAARHPELPLPTRWHFLGSMPRDANGKLDRARLPAPDSPQPRGGSNGLVAVRKRGGDHPGLLVPGARAGRDRRRRHVRTLGGDSFAALELALLMEERLGIAVPPT